jgi:excinuclease ABC subunit A
LGQSATTLSGGEAQRIKLSKELSKRSTGSSLYILDEPTTGLHFEDIKKLTKVLTELRDQGNTIIIIEHNIDVIRCSDWIIDLGLEGGDKGGEVIYQGPYEGIKSCKLSHTAKFL